ncbi:tyrosine-type recombinase/integrase [Pseudomonas lalucatii]|uniref:tyrosine-type recombinase/integrase n=1 Tax=Pseudomonas lalucatii TaxID=1424203 RepID=UPI003B847B95
MRGKSIRIYFRYNGEMCWEPVKGPATAERIAHYERLVASINYEIDTGSFDYARHFPKSAALEQNRFGFYLDLWLGIKRNEVAASSYRGYVSRVENHIRPKWANELIEDIDHLSLQAWVQDELMPKLHNKTIKDIVSYVGQVFRLYRTRNRSAHDPVEGIHIRQPDPDEPDPFTREEIRAILQTPSERQQEVNLAQFMLWSGPRISEAIALAWEDVDLKSGEVTFRRARVRSQYKVTKTRRSKRRIKLLRPALEALQRQYKLTGELPAVEIGVTDRDNRSVRKQRVRFVFHNEASGRAYSTADNYRNGWWNAHLEKAQVRHRGPNQCRHTFASQMLSSGKVTVDWVADQLGHTSTQMVWRHYGKWINEDGPDMAKLVEAALGL